MKKKIKIKFVGRFSDVDKKDYLDILQDRYEVIQTDNPDYIFYSVHDQQHLKYDCVRIFYTGECYTPNFNECDYAIGFDRMTMGDRYARIPIYALYQYRKFFDMLSKRKLFTKDDLKKKTGFCNFVVSNCFAEDKRSIMFDELSQYKKVDSGGRYRNNIGGTVADKYIFQKKYKFSIAFENCSYAGYDTEKIVEAFAAYTIPIYWGDPDIVKDFNPKAFINVHDYPSLSAVAERVKEIDNNDELYLQMINEPIINPEIVLDDLREFLYHIFDQSLSAASRRPSGSLTAKMHDEMIMRHMFFEDKIYWYVRKVKHALQRLKRGSLLSYNNKN